MLIVVTTDGSAVSRQALPHATRLASVIGAEILLLRVLNPLNDCADEFAPTTAEAAARVAARWERALRRTATRMAIPTTVLVEMKPRNRDVWEVIEDVCERNDAKLVAMATSGAGMTRAMLGSVATAVIGKGVVPVMAVGRKARQPRVGLPYHALVTSDGSDAATSVWGPLQSLTHGAPADDIRLTLLRVYEGPSPPTAEPDLGTARKLLTQFRRRAPRRFEIESAVEQAKPYGGTAAGAIQRIAEERDVDTIWMATHGHSFARRVLVGSVAMDVLGHARVPVVLAKARR